MSVLVTNDPRISTTRAIAISDLVITEFDQWTNPKDSMLSGTTICWYPEDFTSEPVE